MRGGRSSSAQGQSLAQGTARCKADGGTTDMIDTKAYGKLREFDGKDDKWGQWSFVARSYISMLTKDAEKKLEFCEMTQDVASLALLKIGEVDATMTRTLYHVLVSSLDGKALAVIRGVERGNGLLAWRALCTEYEPRSGTRLAAMLCGLLSPV